MLTQIDVMSDDAFELPILGITPKSSLLIRKITGLNPPDKSLFIGDFSHDGGLYQGRRVGNRNIVVILDLNPNPALGETVSSLRKALYKAFNDPQVDGDYLKLLFHEDDNSLKYLVGYCEKFETDLFDVETMCQISMICPDPYLRDDADTILTHTTGGWITVNFTYQGTAETGFIVRIYVTSPTNDITLSNNGKLMKLNNPVGAGYLAGDVIVVNTIRGQRSITLTTNSVLTSTPTEHSLSTAYSMNALVFYGTGVWKALSSVPSGGTLDTTGPGGNNPYWTLLSMPIASHLSPTSRWLELHSVGNTLKVSGLDLNDIVANIKYLKYTSAYWGM